MRKLASILLSLLLLTSSTGIAYGRHFCHGFLMKSGLVLNETDLSCGMEKPQTCETRPSKSIDHEKHCCDNDLYQVNTDDHFNGFQFQLKIQPDLQAALPMPVFLLQDYELAIKSFFVGDYGPPPPENDIYLLYQVFLI